MTSPESTTSANDLPVGLGKPATRALAAAGYTQLTQFTYVTEEDLLKLHGVGPKAILLLRTTLTTQGLAFAERDSMTP